MRRRTSFQSPTCRVGLAVSADLRYDRTAQPALRLKTGRPLETGR